MKKDRNDLTNEIKLVIMKKVENGETGASLAKIYKGGKTTISDIENKRKKVIKFPSRLESADESKSLKTMKIS